MAVLRELNGYRYFYRTDEEGLGKKLRKMRLPDRTYYPGDKIIGWEYCLPVIFSGFDGEWAYFELTEYAPSQMDLFNQGEQRLFEPAGVIKHEEIVFSVNHAAAFWRYDKEAGGWRFRGRPSSPVEPVEVMRGGNHGRKQSCQISRSSG